jgi:hypothetical protein
MEEEKRIATTDLGVALIISSIYWDGIAVAVCGFAIAESSGFSLTVVAAARYRPELPHWLLFVGIWRCAKPNPRG